MQTQNTQRRHHLGFGDGKSVHAETNFSNKARILRSRRKALRSCPTPWNERAGLGYSRTSLHALPPAVILAKSPVVPGFWYPPVKAAPPVRVPPTGKVDRGQRGISEWHVI